MTRPPPKNRWFAYALFPCWFVAGMLASSWLYGAGVSAPWVLLGCSSLTVGVVTLAEWLQPAHASWGESRGDEPTDSMHLIVSMVILPKLLEGGWRALALALAAVWTGVGSWWPTSWPMLAQLALAMVTSQLGEYVVHRACHEHPMLWRLHATHHSAQRLYWLNASRFHPLDTTLSISSSLIILLLLGADEEILLLVSTWTAIHGLFQHANIEVRLGPLNWVFSMSELHRWHHSQVLEEANANYGNNILLWDIVFGTVYWPRDRVASERVGLSDMPDFPQDYWGQIRSPWRWRW